MTKDYLVRLYAEADERKDVFCNLLVSRGKVKNFELANDRWEEVVKHIRDNDLKSEVLFHKLQKTIS